VASVLSVAKLERVNMPVWSFTMQNIELHIEELVLRGFPAGSHSDIAEAVERELTRLFVEQGSPVSLAKGGEVTHIGVPAINVEPGGKPAAIGSKVAQALYGGFGK
jgi:hypothetical protein